MQANAFLAMCNSYHERKKQRLSVENKDINPDVELTNDDDELNLSLLLYHFLSFYINFIFI